MIRFRCPSCGKAVSAPDDRAGRKAKCPACDTHMIVPQAPPTVQAVTRPPIHPGAIKPPVIPTLQPVPPVRPRHVPVRVMPTPRSSFPRGAILAGVLVAVFGGGVLVAFVMFRLLSEAPRDANAQVVHAVQVDVKAPAVDNANNPAPAPVPAVVVRNPAPVTKVAPAQQPAPTPVEKPAEPDIKAPLPERIAPDTTKKVKRAAAYLKVTRSDGPPAEGSGFFALQPGIVVTNAHVVGMLRAGADKPRNVEIVANSGQPDEVKFAGTVLGVDRQNDLAILRVSGDQSRMPTPLAVDVDMSGLTELQPVYIFGFPLGANLGKEITIGQATIASFRRDADGSLYQIQLTGNMQPGNSGGPIVDTRGVVIGVAVAIIRATSINFAVPGEKIHGMLHGRAETTIVGERFRDQEEVKLPVRIPFLDPLERVQEVKLDYWTGPPGRQRPASVKPPTPQAGDSSAQSAVMNYKQAAAQLDLVLPTLPMGQVYWLQAEFVDQDGLRQWGPALAYKPSDAPPLDRIPANLVVSTDTQERTLKLVSRYVFQMTRGKEKLVQGSVADLQMLERLEKNATGDEVKLVLGTCGFYDMQGGRKVTRNPAAQQSVRQGIYPYKTDIAGRLTLFGFITIRNKNPVVAAEANSMSADVTTAYQGACLGMPNRQVTPLETWQEKIRVLLMGEKKQKDALDLMLTCTYEGSRTVNGRTEAMVQISGEVRPVNPPPVVLFSAPRDRVVGHALFDVAAGHIRELKLIMNSEFDLEGLLLSRTFAIDLTRTPGNVYGIPVPASTPSAATDKALAGTQPSRVIGGGFGRDPYTDSAPAGGLLVGLEVGVGKFANVDVIQSIRAVFRVGKKESLGPQHGTNLTRVTRLVAKPGYAVGAITVRSGANADGLRLVFMRIKGNQLDPKDSYSSEWVGDTRPGQRYGLEGNGRPVVGIVGTQNAQNNTGIGLLFGPQTTKDDAVRRSP